MIDSHYHYVQQTIHDSVTITHGLGLLYHVLVLPLEIPETGNNIINLTLFTTSHEVALIFKK